VRVKVNTKGKRKDVPVYGVRREHKYNASRS